MTFGSIQSESKYIPVHVQNQCEFNKITNNIIVKVSKYRLYKNYSDIPQFCVIYHKSEYTLKFVCFK